MLLYIEEITSEIYSILEYAELMRKKFDSGRNSEELLLDAKCLEIRIDNLSAMLPSNEMIGNTTRHVYFMIHFLNKNQIERCSDDINDIIEHDLPGVEKSIRDWSNNLGYVDVDLRNNISPLIRTRQFDSAIRKAFVVLKNRLCEKFKLDHKLDGIDLVNELFGKNSKHFPCMVDAERQTYRDLFAGIFGLLRNKFAHNELRRIFWIWILQYRRLTCVFGSPETLGASQSL